MQNRTNPEKLGIWTVLLLICVSTVGCGIVAAQGDSSHPAVQVNGQGNHLSPEPAYSERWNAVAGVCREDGDLAVIPCQEECYEKHIPAGDMIGLFFCDAWCDKNVWLPAFQRCLQKNNCEPAPI
jgi:hypothetical protein